jgi:hypothetical protein
LGIRYTNFQKKQIIGIFQSKNSPLFSGPRAWVGFVGGLAAAARVGPPMCGIGKQPEQQLAA